VLRYPRCLHAGCVGDDPPREVDFSYVRGFLTPVAGYAPSLSYQLGGMLHQVAHANGVTETIATKPGFPMQRPHQITTTGVSGGNNWSSGIYLYDGAGNVKRIGSQRYQYDRMSRLVEGEVLVGGQNKTQALDYDAFGNLESLTTDGSFQWVFRRICGRRKALMRQEDRCGFRPCGLLKPWKAGPRPPAPTFPPLQPRPSRSTGGFGEF
jgi:hypothetical protein